MNGMLNQEHNDQTCSPRAAEKRYQSLYRAPSSGVKRRALRASPTSASQNTQMNPNPEQYFQTSEVIHQLAMIISACQRTGRRLTGNETSMKRSKTNWPAALNHTNIMVVKLAYLEAHRSPPNVSIRKNRGRFHNADKCLSGNYIISLTQSICILFSFKLHFSSFDSYTAVISPASASADSTTNNVQADRVNTATIL